MSSNTSNNKNTKNMEEIQTAMQALIAHCPFRKKPSLWAQTPPFWNTSFFPLRLILAKSYRTLSQTKQNKTRTCGVS